LVPLLRNRSYGKGEKGQKHKKAVALALESVDN
jgi:hypothetical protein